jgi:hypothetical protein
MADGGSSRVHDARFGPRVAPPAPSASEPLLVAVDPTTVIDDYDSFVRALIAKRHALGWSQAELCERAGLQDGYVAKLESWKGPQGRVAGSTSLPLWMGALGVKLIPIDVPPVKATTTLRISVVDLARRISLSAGWALRRA